MRRIFMSRLNFFSVAFIVAAVLGLSLEVEACESCGCGSHENHAKEVSQGDKLETKDLVQTAVAAGTFNSLSAALKAAGLIPALQGKGPFTVFAPTDEAFSKLPRGTVESLLKPENKALLTSILTYHVVPGKVTAKQVVKLDKARSLNGQQIDISVSKKGVQVDKARVVKADIHASNGVIHVIDSVIMPSSNDIVETAVSAGSFETLIAAVKAAGLVDTLKGSGPYTVLAPTDDAFSKLPPGTIRKLLKPENKGLLTSILTYHVLPGRAFASDVVDRSVAKTLNGQAVDISLGKSGVTIDGARVTVTDIDASNGVIHVIDRVIMPNADDIISTAVNAGTFKTLAAALTAGELIGALKQKGPFTVFAPTDEAFAKLPPGTVESLLKPENKSKLQGILKYHVVPGRIYAPDALAVRSAKTLEGSSIQTKKAGTSVRINNATVTKANIDASNGVIHVIDRVLIPGMEHTRRTMTPRSRIMMAINHGSSLYNSGHHKACADLYVKTAHELMHSDCGSMCQSVKTRLDTAVKTSSKMSCQSSRAWAMRHALDHALASLSQ
jgi:uncharacterized surface protein with fasciclin (FAS1) repeats